MRLRARDVVPMLLEVSSRNTGERVPLLFIFVLMPISEIFVLLQVGSLIGIWPTIGCILLTATIGVLLLRAQGSALLLRGARRVEDGGLPAQELLEGFVLAIGGALLLTPGFITDVIGFCCLLPPTRAWIVRNIVIPRIRSGETVTRFTVRTGPHGTTTTRRFTRTWSSRDPHNDRVRDPDVIEGEIVDRDDSRD